MIRIEGRTRAARFVLTATLATAAAVTGPAGPAFAGAPAIPPTGIVLDAGAEGAIADSYIVVLKPGSAAAAQVTSASQQLVRHYGGTVVSNYTATFRGFHARMTATGAARLAADPAVSYVEQDATVSTSATETDAPWGLDRIDQRARPLSGTYTSTTAAGVTAYLLDTGIRVSQHDFAGRASSGWDFIDYDANAADCNGHGTHVAGTIGGTEYGVAKDVQLVGVRVLDCQGSGSYSAIIAGIDWVTAHAVKPAVANLSVEGPKSAALDTAVTRSIAAGISYVVAAGNDHQRACDYSPAATPAAITVGATDAADRRAYFSNYGSCVDLFAPGVQIVSDSYTSDTASAVMSGTSMASPHVAGAVALVLGRNSAWSPAQVRDALVAQADSGIVAARGSGSPNKLLYTGWIDSNAASIPSPTASSCGRFADGGNLRIADRATISSTRRITGCTATATSTALVTVSAKDAYRGSLAVTLIDPSGATHVLKRADKSDHHANLAGSYVVNLAEAPRAGAWTLTVTDTYGSSGYLDTWTLRP
jgi:subtilisin family serine protease